MAMLADGSQSGTLLAPLGAGDLVDRAVRFYRRYFWTLVLIAAPPVITGTLISVGWTVLGRQLFNIGQDPLSAENAAYYVFLWFGSMSIWMIETIATLAVMGGASRNFVRHLLFDEPMSVLETYRNTWKRLPGLIVASSFTTIFLGIFGLVMVYVAMTVAVLAIVIIAAIFNWLPVLTFIVSLVIVGGIAVGATWLFFLVASRLAFIPQVMLVEGQGIFAAIGRSASLAGGSTRRLAALFLFTTVATYSALALLYVPLAWYASSQGVPLMGFDADMIPAWYEISYNLIWQISFILLSPVWMIGLCLLYVDERVRREGYDIELMAARRLGEIPAVPEAYVNPLSPALSRTSTAAVRGAHGSTPPFTTLGLK